MADPTGHKRRTSLSVIRVNARPGLRSRGWLFAGGLVLPVALGRTGIRALKREGDGMGLRQVQVKEMPAELKQLLAEEEVLAKA